MMRSQKSKIIFIISILVITSPIDLYAAGFAVDAQSAAGLSNSHAGETTGAHDISDSYANPAVLSDINSPQLSISGSYVKVNIDDDNGSGKYSGGGVIYSSQNENAGVDAIVPAFHFAAPINKELTTGISITAPFALQTEYNPNWVGRYQTVDSKITTTNINPMLSYKLTDQLSIAGGLEAQYIQARITNMVDIGALLLSSPGAADRLGKVKGDDWGYGFNLGAKYKFNNQFEAGIGYRSKIKHTITGEVEVNGAVAASKFRAHLITPEIATFGLAYKLTPKADLLYDLAWTRWSRINAIDIIAQNSNLSTSTKFGWRDSFRNSFGFNYQTTKELQIRTGLAFEKGASGQYRNPRVPEANKTLVSAGLGYKFNQNFSADLTCMHQFYEKTKNNLAGSDSAAPSVASLKTDYKIRVDVLALGLVYSF